MAAAAMSLLGTACMDVGQPATVPSPGTPESRETPPVDTVSNSALLSGFTDQAVFRA